MLKKYLRHLYGDDSIIPVRQAFWSGSAITFGKTIAFLASFAVFSTLGRYVPREIAGSYNYLIGVITIVSLATLPGMNNALVRAVARGYEGGIKTLLKKRLLFGLLGSCISIAIGIFFYLTHQPQLGLAFIIAAPFVPLTDTFSNFAMSYWQGRKMFARSAATSVVYYVGLAVLSIPLMIFSDDLIVIVTGVFVAQTFMGLVVYYLPYRNANSATDLEAESLGMHLTATQVLRVIASNIDRVITWVLLGPVATAIYTFASTPVTKANQLIPIGVVSLPHLSQHSFTESVKKTVFKQMLLLLLLSIPATLIVVGIAPWLYKIFFPLYPESVFYFQLLFLPIALSPVLLLKFTLTAMNRPFALYVYSIVPPLIKIGAMIIFAIPLGILGVVIGVLIGSVIEATVLIWFFIKEPTVLTKEQAVS